MTHCENPNSTTDRNGLPTGPTPWVNSYPPGVSWDTPIELISIPTLFRQSVAKYGTLPCISFGDCTLTYSELSKSVTKMESMLRAAGFRSGEKAALLLPNTPHYVIALLAVLALGGVIVNISPFDSRDDAVFKFQNSEADVLISLDHSSLANSISAVVELCRPRTLFIGRFQDFASEANWTFKTILCEPAHQQTMPHTIRFKDILISNLEVRNSQGGTEVDASSLAVLQYTGGTTGFPKAAMLTHANLTASAQMYRALNGGTTPVFAEGAEVFLVVLPLSHIYGLSAIVLRGLLIGAHLVLHPRFEPEKVLSDIQHMQVTFLAGVPTMFMALADSPGLDAAKLSSLKYCNSGGAPLPLKLRRRFEELTGKPLLEGWGMTETSPAGTSTPFSISPKDGSCGLPLPRVMIEIISLDEPRSAVPIGTVGEVCVSGPNVMIGYWKQPVASETAFLDGRFLTGDIGYLDQDGFLHLIDRKKELIITNGLKVYPRRIEEAIYAHPSVSAVLVVAEQDNYHGEVPKAFVELRTGCSPFPLADLTKLLEGRLARHEMPKYLQFMDQLPRTATGKLTRLSLKSTDATPSDSY
jgi:long-chain acyl-CoA synthetase